MKNLYISFISLLLTLYYHSEAQIHLQPSLPQAGMIQSGQLWNLVIINGSPQVFDGVVEINLKDRNTGMDILSGTSNRIKIKQGANVLNFNTVSPVHYNTGGALTGTNSWMKVGQYIICYQLLSIEGDLRNSLAQDCHNFDVEPLSPPELIQPEDSATLPGNSIMFSWIPPGPPAVFERLNYQFVIAENLEGQSGEEALQFNIPVFSTAGIYQNSFVYSGAYPSLEKGKIYSWQVVAMDGEQFAAKSQVNSFSLETSDKPAITFKPETFYILDEKSRNSLITVNDYSINLQFYSFDKSYSSAIKIFNSSGVEIGNLPVNVVYGTNYFRIELPKETEQNKNYRVILKSLSGKEYSLGINFQDKK